MSATEYRPPSNGDSRPSTPDSNFNTSIHHIQIETVLVVAEEDPADWVKILGSRIVHLHVKDAKKIHAGFEFPPLPERTMRFSTEFEYLPLGKGVIDFRAMVGALRETGYAGFLSMEYEGIFFGYKEDPWEVAVQTKSFLANLLS